MATSRLDSVSVERINEVVIAIAKRLHPYYRTEPRGGCVKYSKTKFLDTVRDYIAIRVNYDNFGKVYLNDDGTFDIRINCGMGVFHEIKKFKTFEEAVEQMIKGYFHI